MRPARRLHGPNDRAVGLGAANGREDEKELYEKDAFLQELNGLSCENKSATQLYNEISALAVKYIEPDERPKRCAHYLSIEFLIGRVFITICLNSAFWATWQRS